MKYFDNSSSLIWTFLYKKFVNNESIFILIKMHKLSVLRKLSVLMKNHHVDEIHYFYSSPTVMKIHHISENLWHWWDYENSSFWLKFILLIKLYYFDKIIVDESSTLMKIRFAGEIHHYDETSFVQKFIILMEISSPWWKFISL